MHELFTKVLAKRDLSRAGDLFSVADSEIVNDLTNVLTEIEVIVSQPDYLQNKNDQSVMEICVTRVTSCIRETKSVERHCTALVALLNSCLRHNLQTLGNEEPPHAKISADLISSIFLNYNKKSVMEMALPVAIKFLQKGNRELSKNLASYLSLAAIEYAYLLSPHIAQILDSIAIANYGLCQILPQIYEVSPEMLDKKVLILIPLLRSCEVQERLALLQLFTLMAKRNPSVLEGSIQQICDTLTVDLTTTSSQVTTSTMHLLLRLAEEFPTKLLDHFPKIKTVAEKHPSVISVAAQVLTTAGKINRGRAQFALDFVLQHLPHADRTSQAILLREATILCSTYPVLFNDKVLACVRQKNNSTAPAAATTTTATAIPAANLAPIPISIASMPVGPPTIMSPTNSVVTSFDETTTTTTTVSARPPQSLLQQQHHQQQLHKSNLSKDRPPPLNGFNGRELTTTTTTSGGVTIVKLNVAPLVAHPNPMDTMSPGNGLGLENPPVNRIGTGTGGGGGGDRTGTAVLAISQPPMGSTANGVMSPPHIGYTRRTKYDSRSTGRLHSAGNTHRSMTRLNIAAGGSVNGGLHKSMTRLSSSQQINNNNNINNNIVNSNVNPVLGGGSSSTSTNQNPSHSSGSVAQSNPFNGSLTNNSHNHQYVNSNSNVNGGGGGPTSTVGSPNYVTPVPPLSSNVIITGHNKWGIPSTKITSGGVTVTTSPTRVPRPHSQGPSTLLMMTGGSNNGGLAASITNCNISNSHGNHSVSGGGGIGGGSSTTMMNAVSVHHAAPASPTSSIMTLPVNANNMAYGTTKAPLSNQVNVLGHNSSCNTVTVTSRRNDNTSVTLINAAAAAAASTSPPPSNRMSVFEPVPPERDTIQHFSEKHYDKIKMYIDNVELRVPPAAKCTIEERRAKKFAKLHFACQMRGPHCLYNAKTLFTMRTRNAKTWIHLMFLDQQARAGTALSSRDAAVSSLRHCWDILRCENKSFVTLATSAFPPQKDVDAVVNELRNSGYFDVFELGPWSTTLTSNNNNNNSASNNANGGGANGGGGGGTGGIGSGSGGTGSGSSVGGGSDKETGNNDSVGSSAESVTMQWGCFLCNHPEKAMGFLQGNTQPVIEGQLKEKKGKWRLFRRWRTRYFTLSGAHLSCKGSSGGESIDINQIRSLKVSRGARNIPKAFEIFTGDQTLILKPKDGKNAEEWVQCLSIVVAHSQGARDPPVNKTNSLPARANSRTAF